METKTGTLIELSNIPHYTIQSNERIPQPKFRYNSNKQTLQSDKFTLYNALVQENNFFDLCCPNAEFQFSQILLENSKYQKQGILLYLEDILLGILKTNIETGSPTMYALNTIQNNKLAQNQIIHQGGIYSLNKPETIRLIKPFRKKAMTQPNELFQTWEKTTLKSIELKPLRFCDYRQITRLDDEINKQIKIIKQTYIIE
jgi:hypothetical protein